MQCISPMSVKRPNGYGSVDRITVPCGNCPSCLSRKRQEWCFRLQSEAKIANSAYFVTLTYDDDNIPIRHIDDSGENWDRLKLFINDDGSVWLPRGVVPSLYKRDIQLFMKSLRQNVKDSEMRKLRYFIVGEYGPETLRPHYHGLFFNLPGVHKDKNGIDINSEVVKVIDKSWKRGFVSVGDVTDASINYCAKYAITPKSDIVDRVPQFMLCSKKPGIGYNYLKSHGNWHNPIGGVDKFYGIMPGGIKVNLPRYYRNKLFNKTENRIHSEDVKLELDKIENEKLEKLFRNGENIGLYELENKRQLKERFENLKKKNRKL